REGRRFLQSPQYRRVSDGQVRVAVNEQKRFGEQADGVAHCAARSLGHRLATIAKVQPPPSAVAEILLDLFTEIPGQKDNVSPFLPCEFAELVFEVRSAGDRDPRLG